MFAAVSGALALLAPSVAAADEPLIVQASPARPVPAFTVGVQAGVTNWSESTLPFGTDTAIGQALAEGYNFGIRASAEVLPWLAFDVRGVYTHNLGNRLANGGTMATLGGLGAARLTLPLDYVRPYLLLGFGAHHMGASGAGTTLISSTTPSYETGLGALVPVGKNFDVGIEYLYSHLIGEKLATDEEIDGGDPATTSLFVQYRFGNLARGAHLVRR